MSGEQEKSIADVWALVHEMKAKLEAHIEEETEYKPKLMQLLLILEQSKGVVAFLKASVYVGGSLIALLYWCKEHIKL